MRDINNFTFIDSQNVNLAIRDLGWKIDWIRSRVYLKSLNVRNYHFMNDLENKISLKHK